MAEGTVYLREKKVVLDATPVYPQQEFHFPVKNTVAFRDGKSDRMYKRQQRGVHTTWFEEVLEIEPCVVTGDWHDRLELAYSLINGEKNRVALAKFAALARKRKPLSTK